jgi:hypothetical protein
LSAIRAFTSGATLIHYFETVGALSVSYDLSVAIAEFNLPDEASRNV